MPGHTDCCLRPVLTWMRRTLKRPRLSLRGDYLPPEGGARPGTPAGYTTREEYGKARVLARAMGMEIVE
jgi:uncharacterized Fe-S radical SAM superfamily protein PflX